MSSKPYIVRGDRNEDEPLYQFKMSPSQTDPINFVSINSEGEAQISNKHLECHSLRNLFVQKVLFGGNQWVAFLGFRSGSENSDDSFRDDLASIPVQVIEFYSTHDVSHCALTLSPTRGVLFNDFDVLDENYIAIALQDGSVAIKEIKLPLVVPYRASKKPINFHCKDVVVQKHTDQALNQVVYATSD